MVAVVGRQRVSRHVGRAARSLIISGGTNISLNVAECAQIGVRVTLFHVISHTDSARVHLIKLGAVIVE